MADTRSDGIQGTDNASRTTCRWAKNDSASQSESGTFEKRRSSRWVAPAACSRTRISLRMRIGKESVERKEGVIPHPDFHGGDGRFAERHGMGAPSENTGEEAGRYGQSENGRTLVIGVENPNGEDVGILQNLSDSRRKFGMDVGNEKHRGFRTDFLRNFPHGHDVGSFRREAREIAFQYGDETAEFGMRERGLENPDSTARVRDGSGAVAGSDGACGNEFENGNRLVETRGSLFSKTHGRRNVDDAPNRNLTVGDEGFYQSLPAAQTRLPVDGAGIVGFGIRTQSAEFYALAGKYRSVFPRRKRDGVAEFGEVEKTHVTWRKNES